MSRVLPALLMQCKIIPPGYLGIFTQITNAEFYLSSNCRKLQEDMFSNVLPNISQTNSLISRFLLTGHFLFEAHSEHISTFVW